MRKAGVPKDKQKYRTRTTVCLDLLKLYSKRLPHRWITGDDEMGQPAGFRRELRTMGEQYLLAVPKNTSVADLEIPAPTYEGFGRPPVRPSIPIAKWATQQPSASWEQIDVRDGEKGPVAIELLKGRVETSKRSKGGVAEEVGVVIRYRARDEAIVKQDYYLSNAPFSTAASEFARAAKAEHRIEECFDRGKGEAGMADYEVRGWVGWQHHQTLTMIASWFLNVGTRQSEKKGTGNDVQPSSAKHRIASPRRTAMRFAPRRRVPNRTKTIAKSTREALSLETTQPASTT